MDHDIDDVIDGRYRLLEVLGEGGQGVVYRAEDLDLGSQVAVKCLHPHIAADPAVKARMRREARAMGALSGTSATQIIAFPEAPDGSLYIVMEFLKGSDLETTLRDIEQQGGKLPLDRLRSLFGPIVDTLAAAHGMGIIHRDLKPANIFVLEGDARGGVRLLDFGLVKVVLAAPITLEGTIPGSPNYIAPEVWKGRPQEVDHRIDVYSLGAVLFRSLAGRIPFKGKTRVDVLLASTGGPRPSLYADRPDLPPEVDAWVESALAISPDDRFQSVRDLWNALDPLLSRAAASGEPGTVAAQRSRTTSIPPPSTSARDRPSRMSSLVVEPLLRKVEPVVRQERVSQRRFHVRPDTTTGILYIKVWGFWNVEESRAYLDEFRQKAPILFGKPWYVLADIGDFQPQKADVSSAIEKSMNYARENGMRRAANLVNSALTKMQISRLSADTGLPDFSFFTSEADAVAWLLKGG